MEQQITDALESGGVCDITTTGRKSGNPSRIEIYFHHFDGEFFITGKPGFKRDWLANLATNPDFTLHLKRGVTADLAAKAEVVDTQEEREVALYKILTESWGTEPEQARADLPRWVGGAPLVRFSVG